jgi:hypothetical protein
MGARRFTRLTNAFSKKFEDHCHMVAIYHAYYNFCRVHPTLRVTPAMEAGLTDHVCSLRNRWDYWRRKRLGRDWYARVDDKRHRWSYVRFSFPRGGKNLAFWSAEQREKALKEMHDRVDKAMEGTNDPNEPARWVPLIQNLPTDYAACGSQDSVLLRCPVKLLVHAGVAQDCLHILARLGEGDRFDELLRVAIFALVQPVFDAV